MLRFPQRLVLSGMACALLAALGVVAWGLAAGPSEAQSGSMDNCPPAGKWSIAVWEGDSGAAADAALATCGAGKVAAAYSLDPQTGGWSRWFAGKPDVSNLPPLSDLQGVLALGGTAAAAAAADPLVAAQASGQFHNCPPAGKWSIAVWEGESGTAAADALAACGDDAVAAAYSLDSATGAWSRWFAGKPDVSNLPPLNDMQGMLALGVAAGPVATPTPVVTPTPAGTSTPGTGDVTLVSTNSWTGTSTFLIDGEGRTVTVVGELRNDSPTDRSVGVTIRFYDDAGQQVGIRKTVPFDNILRPGRTTAFNEYLPSLTYYEGETNDYPEGWTRYEITSSSHDASAFADTPVDMTVENVQISDDGRHVTGNVVNTSSKTAPAYSVSAYAIYRQEDGTILNAAEDPSLNQNPLAPGESMPFDITLYGPVDFSSYVVQAYAEPEYH